MHQNIYQSAEQDSGGNIVPSTNLHDFKRALKNTNTSNTPILELLLNLKSGSSANKDHSFRSILAGKEILPTRALYSAHGSLNLRLGP